MLFTCKAVNLLDKRLVIPMNDKTATTPTELQATARATVAEAPAPSGSFSSLRSMTIGRLVLTIPVLLALMLPASAASVAPQPISPPNGAGFTANTPIRFEVSSQPNDPLILIQISRSLNIDPRTGILWAPDVYYFDTAKESKPASGIYDWTPPSFIWKDPGTYYWQPFHISFAEDPEGRVEGSAVRSLQIASPPPAPQASPPAAQPPQKSQAKSKPKKKQKKRKSHVRRKKKR